MSQANAQRAYTGEQTESAGRRPVETVRHGIVEIAIWKNASSKGDFFSASSPLIRYNDSGE